MHPNSRISSLCFLFGCLEKWTVQQKNTIKNLYLFDNSSVAMIFDCLTLAPILRDLN